jgi:hypothetical protein
MEGAARTHDPRRIALLLEQVVTFEDDRRRPSARERLERVIGGYLARLLVGALSGDGRSRTRF